MDYLIRTVGGPYPGDRVVRERDWPPPDRLPVPDSSGEYVKTSGAEYRWQPSIVDLWEVPAGGHS